MGEADSHAEAPRARRVGGSAPRRYRLQSSVANPLLQRWSTPQAIATSFAPAREKCRIICRVHRAASLSRRGERTCCLATFPRLTVYRIRYILTRQPKGPPGKWPKRRRLSKTEFASPWFGFTARSRLRPSLPRVVRKRGSCFGCFK